MSWPTRKKRTLDSGIAKQFNSLKAKYISHVNEKKEREHWKKLHEEMEFTLENRDASYRRRIRNLGLSLSATVVLAAAGIAGTIYLNRSIYSDNILKNRTIETILDDNLALRNRISEKDVIIASKDTEIQYTKDYYEQYFKPQLRFAMENSLAIGPMAKEEFKRSIDNAITKADLVRIREFSYMALNQEQTKKLLLYNLQFQKLAYSFLSYPFANPGNCYLEDPYGMRSIFGRPKEMHYGIDLVSPYDRDLLSMGNGKVIAVYYNDPAYGNNIYAEFKDDISGTIIRARFCHLETIEVKKGMTLRIGQSMGMIGTTGHSTGFHLHLELYYRNKGAWITQNPLKTNPYGGGMVQ